MALCISMIDMREKLIQEILNKKRKVKDVADILWVSRKTIHKWKRRYIHYGRAWLIPRKSWPKRWTPRNKTPDHIEQKVIELAQFYRRDWPVELADKLEREEWIKIDQSTVYRILKRNCIRYHPEWEKPKKKKPTLYVLDRPWREIQVDTSFPFWYSRKLVVYSWIDDCSRLVFSMAYERHTLESTQDYIAKLAQRSPFQIEKIRTDQWREFSQTITEYLYDCYSIEHIKNQPYHPEHNGKVERYHRTMKAKEISYRPYTISVEEANYRLWLWSSYYNTQRKHSWLWMDRKTPYQVVKEKTKNVTLILQ